MKSRMLYFYQDVCWSTLADTRRAGSPFLAELTGRITVLASFLLGMFVMVGDLCLLLLPAHRICIGVS